MSIQSVEPHRHRVVVIGSGFGGLFGTQALKKADADITMIARTTHHLFQPLLYQVATGILSVGDIAPATRLVLRKQKNAQVLLGEVETIDLENQTVTSRLLERVTVTPFDSLIVAAGAGQSYFGNDQFAEFAPGMKTIDDALEPARTNPRGLRTGRTVGRSRRACALAHLRRCRRRPHRRGVGRADRRAFPSNAGRRVPQDRSS